MRFAIPAVVLLAVLADCKAPTPTQPTDPETLDARTMHLTRRAIGDTSTGTIEGHVRDVAQPEPVVGATLVVTPMAPPTAIDPAVTLPELIATAPAPELVAESDAHGNYVVNDLAPGAYGVALYFDSVSSAVTNIDVAAGFATRVDLTVDQRAPIRGETVRLEHE